MTLRTLLPFLTILVLVAAGAVMAADVSPAAASSIKVPPGGALTEGEIVILLQTKVPLDLIQEFVTVRGVSFPATKDSSKRIIAAGGNVALIGTINLNQKDELVASAADTNGKKK
jgi:hypothetical protein